MTRIRLITMALVAVFCVSAFAATGALAAGKGEIVNKTGAAPVLKGFKGTSAAKGLLETGAGQKISCKETRVSGTISSKTTGTASFVFTGCESGGNACKTTGAAAKEIVAPVILKGTTSSGKDEILNEVKPTLVISCGGTADEVKGSLLIPATPEGSLSTKYKFEAVGSKGKQTPEETENRLLASFEGKGFEDASISAEKLEVLFQEEIEFI